MKVKWGISFIFTLFVLAFLTFGSYKNKVYDWDMPGYIGCLFSSEYPDFPQKVHDLTYWSIKKEAPDLQFKDIIGLDKVSPGKAKNFFYKNTEAFTEQIAYYKLKIGYNFLISILYKAGLSAPMSILWISIISYFFSGLLLFYIFNILFPENYFLPPIFTFLVLVLPPVSHMSTTPSPDMLTFLFLLFFAAALLKKCNYWIIFSMLLLLILIRPDYIVFALSYFATAIIFNYFSIKKFDFLYLCQAFILLVLYIFIVKYYEYPGWKEVFYDTFIERRPLISAKAADFGVREYFEVLFIKLINFKKITLASLSLVGLIFYFSKDLWIRVYSAFLFLNIYIKFLFFPASSDTRFFIGFIVLLFVMFLYSLSKKYNGFKLRKIA
jgi:hypothetical protein